MYPAEQYGGCLPEPFMKIAFFFDLFPGGAFFAMKKIAEEFSVMHQVDLYELRHADRQETLCSEIPSFRMNYRTIPLLSKRGFIINPVIKILNLGIYYFYNLKMARLINSKKYDVCMVHPSCFLQFPFIIRMLRPLTLVYAQEINRVLFEKKEDISLRKKVGRIWYYPVNQIYRFFDRCNLKSADRIWCNSDFTGSGLRKVYHADAVTMYLGIDTNAFKNRELERENIVLSIGHTVMTKGHDFVIDCMSVSEFREKLTLVIVTPVSYPENEKFLSRRAGSAGVKIKFMFSLSRNRLVEMYNRSKMVLYFPLREPFGLVPLEALACGTPVIAVDEGGIRETLPEESGGIRLKRDKALVAGTMDRLLSDESVWMEHSVKGEQYVSSSWSWNERMRPMLTEMDHIKAGKNADG